MLRKLCKLVGFAALCTFSHSAVAQEDFPKMHEWFRAPKSVTELYANQLDERDFTPVTPEHRAEAVKALADKNFQKINPAQAAHYKGTLLSAGVEEHLYLVRALRLESRNGHYSAYFANNTVLVSFGTMGNKVPPVERDALVVSLPEALHEAYVIYHVVQ